MKRVKLLAALLCMFAVSYDVYSSQENLEQDSSVQPKLAAGGYFRITYTEEVGRIDYGTHVEVTARTVTNCMSGGSSPCQKGVYTFKYRLPGGAAIE